MPSDLFQQLALSQLELLANSLVLQTTPDNNKSSKIGSMALYLPQENANTGQLEFLPAVIYPHPSTERVFIASEADSGVAARLPRLLTKLPGFAAPDSLLPRYPMVSSNIAGVGVAEEVLCDVQSGAPALSVPLFMGSQTVGVLLVSPAIISTTTSSSTKNKSSKTNKKNKQVWSEEDRAQIIRAAQTLSMALSMDTERSSLALENKRVQDALSNSLHQVKNPLQALRTFGKLLQQRVAEQNEIAATNGVGTIRQLLDLTANLVEQSDRVVNLLAPMDLIVESMETPLLYLNPARPEEDTALVLWNQTETTPPAIPWEIDTLEFARSRGESSSNAAAQDAPPKRSKSNNHQTLEFSSSNRRISRNSTVEEFSRRKPSGTRRKKASRQKHMMGEVTHFERGDSRRNNNNNNRPATTTNLESASSASIVGNDGLEIGFVADVLGPTLNAYEVIGAERGISFQVLGLEDAEELPGVFVRPKSLKEAFSNIVDNAFKYVAVTKTIDDDYHPERSNTNEEPIVRVHLKGNDNPPGVTILVEDNGPGILPEEAEAVFQRGYRSSSVSSWVLGTGLGLGLARALVESMGGRLDCLDQPDKQVKGLLEGAAFQIELYRNKDRLRSEDFASE
ncbi:HisKA [Seminavis robusta]|uniref:histidine kinase n=1 Tax=Seminavis robusta TaxID=568900 RepID=A0A9N8EHZ7_9STRA|nr:HisKA [Seminavis robusta]|eukprot:Sro1222_g253800.1 HisKA (623) ;mRNA; f:14807-16675